MNKKLQILSALCALSLCQAASASINYYSLTMYASYNQNSDAMPADSPICYLVAQIGATTNGDLLTAQLVTPAPLTVDFYDASYQAGTFFQCYTGPYTSIGDMVTANPDGNYDFNILSGGAAPDSATFVTSPADFSNEIPYLSDGSHSALQMWPSNTDAPVSWPSFSHNGSMPESTTNFILFDYTENLFLFENVFTESATGDTIPAALMKSGHTYGYNLNYQCQQTLFGQGFGGASNYEGYLRTTGGQLHCAANPGTVAGQLTLNNYYYTTGQPVTVQVVGAGGVVEDEQTITLGYLGHYAFDTAVTGVKTITFKNPRFLRLAVENVDLGVGQDFISPSLINGDVDDDNVVSVFDYIILSDAFDTTPADALWDARADLDGDSVISVFDYIILSDSFDQQGYEL